MSDVPDVNQCTMPGCEAPKADHTDCRPLANRIPRSVEICSDYFTQLVDSDDSCILVTSAYFFSTGSSNSLRSSSSAEAGRGRGLFGETPASCTSRRVCRREKCNVECFDQVLLSESGTPCWRVVTNPFGWTVKNSGELFRLIVGEFRWTTKTRLIVERGLKAALFEPVQPVVGGLVVSAVLVFDVFWRQPAKILTRGSKTLDRLRIGFVRELPADSLLRETGNLVSVLGHTLTWSWKLSRLPTDNILYPKPLYV